MPFLRSHFSPDDKIEFLVLAGLGQAEVSALARAHSDLVASQILVYRKKLTLGLPEFTHRALRRMFITSAIGRGVDVKIVSEWQGRKAGQLILATYSHVNAAHSQRMVQLMTDRKASRLQALRQVRSVCLIM